MTYTFNPLTDEQIDTLNLIEEGSYDFCVSKSTRKNSNAGNPMAELIVEVWDIKGKSHTVFDYLVFSSVPLNIKKIKHFCDSVGLQERYLKGELPEELKGLSGKVNIGIKDKQPNGSGGFYPAKNYVIDYLPQVLSNQKSEKQSDSKDFIDDDVPF